MHTSLIEACNRYLTENPLLKDEVYTPEQAADLFIKNMDREDLLIYGRAKIVRAFEVCKNRNNKHSESRPSCRSSSGAAAGRIPGKKQ